MDRILSFTYGDEKNQLLPVYVDTTMVERVERYTRYKTVINGYALVCCTEGELIVRTQDKDIIIGEGRIFFLMNGKSYQYCSKETGCRLKIITFNGPGACSLIEYFGIGDFKIYTVTIPYFEVGFQRISQDMHLKNFYGASLGFQHMLYEVVRCGTPDEDEKNIEILKRYIERNYCQDIDNQTLAKIYGTSISYLCREFREQYKISPMAYINNLRIEKACKMLVASRKKVSVIAVECGFSNAEYFCYAFKKSMQCTPLQYRKMKSVFY